MTISSLFSSPVSGIRTQSQAIGAIADNVANAVTTGYKATDTIARETFGRSSVGFGGSGVNGLQINRIQNEGTLSFTGRTLDYAIAGNGFFATLAEFGDNETLELTAAGSFDITARIENNAEQAYITDLKGNYLLASRIDPNTGQELGIINNTNSLEEVNVSPDAFSLDPQPTSVVDFKVNLAAQVLPGATYDSSVTVFNGTGSITDSSNREQVNLTFTRSVTQDGVHYLTLDLSPENATLAALNPVENPEAGFEIPENITPANDQQIILAFNESGTLIAPQQTNFTLAFPAVGDQPERIQPIELNLAATFTGETNFIQDVSVNGYPSGALTSYNFTEDGTISGTFSNNEIRDIYRIPVARVRVQDSLTPIDGTHFRPTLDSGDPFYVIISNENNNVSQVNFAPGALEDSTVDLAKEFIVLIEAQRGLQFSSRVLQTIDQLLETASNIK